MADHDIDLAPHDIGDLAGRDLVRAFFGRLGYPVDRGRETFPDALGMSASLTEAVKHVEVIAEDELGLLTVYLAELSSVTVLRIQELAAHFRNHPGDVLAILTSDYQRIDFVLFERQQKQSRSAVGAVRVLPRRLTVVRQQADNRVTLRALRRFTWTEPDGLAQWEKLRSAFSIGEWSEDFFDNRGLFADYYLKQRLPELGELWNASGLREAKRDIGSLLMAGRANCGEQDEQALRDQVFEPVAKALGFDARPRKGACDASAKCPDYELFDPATGDRLAACLVYQWDRFLDGPDPGDKATGTENPGAVVLSVLESEGNPWVIVTNGKHWRLYTRKTEARATSFFQIDAEEAAADTDVTAFRYFWLLFRAEAFRTREVAVEGETRALNLLDELLDRSREYAKQVGDRLKVRVFDRIFPILAEGFIANIRAQEGPDASLPQERLDLVYGSTLVLLYRLLFLLYAESRDLLPVREVGGYFEKSLTALKRQIADTAGPVESVRDDNLADLTNDGSPYWDRLTELFGIVAKGRPSANVPEYDGGLFLAAPEEALDERERQIAHFLTEHEVDDLHLARALDRLARDPDDKTHGLVMIDYKSLGVRQLGSIYEGLLEFRLRIPDQLMAVCDRKGSEVVLPYDEAAADAKVKIKKRGRGNAAEEDLIPAGKLYLENAKHERKASGSYYTPDYIVTYIVENAVGPVLAEKLAALRDDLNRACADVRRQEKTGKRVDQVQVEERPLIARVFDLKVLDPAMGSGHFLVTAVDFVADRLIHFLNGFPGNPVERLLRQTRRDILSEVEKSGVTVDENRLTDVNLLKRHVLKRCVYGVDLNPMAVELAKVSLWLHCFTLGAPLSFLDHHLKWGNSLIGEVAAIETDTGPQVTLGGMSRWHDFTHAVANYLVVSELADATASQVLASRKQFQEAEKTLRTHREECNVLTARHFEGWKDAQVGSAQQAASAEKHPGRPLYDRAQALAGQHRFFHWPLEFPEVWYGTRPGTDRQIAPKGESAGFDAVVGNPPYIRIQNLREASPDQPPYLKERFVAASKGSYDIYVVFAERGLQILDSAGVSGMILPNKFITTDYGQSLRCLLTQRRAVRAVVDFQHHQVFDSATTYTCLLFLQTSPGQVTRYVRPRPLDIITGTENDFSVEVPAGADVWTSSDDAVLRIDAKLAGAGPSLLDLPSSVSRGSSTGDDTVFMLAWDGFVLRDHSGSVVEMENQILRAPLFATDFGRYRFAPRNDRRVIFPYRVEKSGYHLIPEDELSAACPLAYGYLRRNRAKLESRKQTGAWYGFSAPRNLDVHQRAHLLVPLLAEKGSYAVIGEQQSQYCLMASGGFSIAVENTACADMYVLGLLNSALLYWRLARISNVFRAGWVTCTKQYVGTLPIRVVDFSDEVDSALHDELVSAVRAMLDFHARLGEATTDGARTPIRQEIDDTDALIDQIVYRLYGLTEAEVAIVEGRG